MKPVRVEINDRTQKGYVYYRTKPMGREFHRGNGRRFCIGPTIPEKFDLRPNAVNLGS
jgi:hypothetical protein